MVRSSVARDELSKPVYQMRPGGQEFPCTDADFHTTVMIKKNKKNYIDVVQ